ncbi:MAG TPA: hypothetical protein ENJ56_03345 [Anaerolineae bacterium]|nr:hypothetical protein [Anaerolineae bacterium]
MTPLTISPTSPALGEVVSADFSIRNNASTPITFARIGAGGRGPNCADWSCTSYSDFPLYETISLAAGATYTYHAERTFFSEGQYFAQFVYQTPDGAWYFAGSRVNFLVTSALQLPQPLQLSTQNPAQHNLTFATFTLHNAGSQPLSFQKVGVSVRGPACTYLDWGCGQIVDFEFSENVTLAPGQSVPFEMWRSFADVGDYFAQIALQDAAGVWYRVGDVLDFTTVAPTPTPRLSPWKLGVHYHPVWNEQDGVRLALARQSGVELVRIAVAWQLLEPNFKGGWDTNWYLPALTNVIDEANRLGMQVLVVVNEVPCWASADPNRNCSIPAWNTHYPARNNQDYADALRKLVQLFADKVIAWEIWNEPNDVRFWQPQPDAAAYSQLLQTAYTTIKAEASGEIVLGGSLAGADIDFLLAMYANGARDSFDALALHPYSGTVAPTECPNLRSSFGCGVEAIHTMMAWNNDAKPIWFTEFGWSDYIGTGGVGSAQHLAFLQDALAMLENWEFVPVATWYNLIDTTSASGTLEFEDHMGWFRPNLQPKNSATWLRERVLAPLTNKLYLPIIRQ